MGRVGGAHRPSADALRGRARLALAGAAASFAGMARSARRADGDGAVRRSAESIAANGRNSQPKPTSSPKLASKLAHRGRRHACDTVGRTCAIELLLESTTL